MKRSYSNAVLGCVLVALTYAPVGGAAPPLNVTAQNGPDNPVAATNPVPAGPGFVNYVEGSASIGGKPLDQNSTGATLLAQVNLSLRKTGV